jgi:hypothetical protein
MKYPGRRQNGFIAQGLSSIGVDVKVILTPPCIFYSVLLCGCDTGDSVFLTGSNSNNYRPGNVIFVPHMTCDLYQLGCS